MGDVVSATADVFAAAESLLEYILVSAADKGFLVVDQTVLI
jgi:hypothetical protein